jgi:hypothetical protein
MRRGELTGLPTPIERHLVDRFGRTASARHTLAAAVKALSVLARRHPAAALDMAATAAVKTGRVGVHRLAEKLSLPHPDPPVANRQPPSRTEIRRSLRVLKIEQSAKR